MALTPGTRLGVYEITALIGEGGMGQVYRATDTKLERPVAIKFVLDRDADAEARARFRRETQMASALNHPHILTVYDVGQFESYQLLVTEFVDGGTLSDWLRARPRHWRETIEILVGVADGLATAHDAGILHRDLKPDNILVAKNGYAKLADFGLAKLQDEATVLTDAVTRLQTRAGLIVGTVPYMSPEQAAGRPLDARSDVFSFGVVLYEALAGCRPFEGANDLEVLQRIAHSQPRSFDADVPAELKAVVARTLEKEPSLRPSSMREVVESMRRLQWSGGTTSSAKPLFPSRMMRRLLPVAALGLLAALAAGALRVRQSEYFWVNPLADANVERLTDFDGEEVNADISPDGKFVTFVADRDGQFDAWLTSVGSGEFLNLSKGQFKLPNPPSPIRFAGFNADGSQVWISEQITLQPNKLRVWMTSVMGGTLRPFREDVLEPVWSPDGRRFVYHLTDPGDPIFIADANGPAKQIFIEKPGVHCHYLSWSADGLFIYFVKGTVTNEEMDIWRLPVTGGTPERITQHNGLVTFPAWLDDHTLIYTAPAENSAARWLYSIDVERRVPHRISSGIAEQYLSVAISASRPRRLVASVATPTASLWRVPLSEDRQTEAAVTRFSVPNARALAPRFGPDSVFFLSSIGGEDGIWALTKDGAHELWKGGDGGVVAAPAVSPDGQQVCFSYRKAGRAGLYLMNRDGTNVRSLGEALDVRGAATWSPDGTWIVAAANMGKGTRLYKIPADGGAPVALLDALAYNPVWSPDGRMVLYAEAQQGGGFMPVKAVSPEGAAIPMPQMQVAYVGSPFRFVPGRREIVFLKAAADGRRQNFYLMDLNTNQERQLTDLTPGFLMRSFDVSPDGREIIFDRTRENANIVLMTLAK